LANVLEARGGAEGVLRNGVHVAEVPRKAVLCVLANARAADGGVDVVDGSCSPLNSLGGSELDLESLLSIRASPIHRGLPGVVKRTVEVRARGAQFALGVSEMHVHDAPVDGARLLERWHLRPQQRHGLVDGSACNAKGDRRIAEHDGQQPKLGQRTLE
jgi:hypothetical protein